MRPGNGPTICKAASRDGWTIYTGSVKSRLYRRWSLADPDRVFVGGGGIAVLDAVLARLRPGGVVVASYAIMERAVQAARRLGNLVQINVSRGVETGDLGLRLVAENPVFITWSSTTA